METQEKTQVFNNEEESLQRLKDSPLHNLQRRRQESNLAYGSKLDKVLDE